MRALLYQTYLFASSWYDQYEHDDPWIILKTIYDSSPDAKRSPALDFMNTFKVEIHVMPLATFKWL